MARPVIKREKILQGVVEVVGRKGLRGSTIQDIATAAGVSPGLLYRYWKNRDELAAEVYLSHYHKFMERLTERAAAHSDVRDKLEEAIRELLEFAEIDPEILRFMLLSQHDLHRRVPEQWSLGAFLHRIFEDGIAQKRLRPVDPALAIQLFLGLALQPVVGSLYGRLAQPVGHHTPAIVEAVGRALFLPGGRIRRPK